MNHSRKILTILCFMLGIAFAFSPTASYAASGTKPRTSAPPIMMHTDALYSGYTYLYSGTTSIKDNLNQTADITITTQSKSTVQEVGGTVYLQEWTGSTWVDVGNPTTLSLTNTTYCQKVATKTTASGYYFRARVIHFVHQAGKTEEVEEFSDYILAN
jgi:hypothetical protein